MEPITVGSLFSGIGGIDEAMRRCGFHTEWAAEIDTKCNSVRRRHFPNERTYTDVADIRGDGFTTNIITAGWPCQGNSVAGRRAGMADERSGLWREVVRILAEQRPSWFIGENVPGILSVNGGRDWLTVLRDLAELGYGTAYRVLDAQWFGVPQRRFRVFVVGCFGDWRRSAEVLFESESLPWDSPPSRKAGKGVAGTIDASSGRSRGAGINPGAITSMCLNAKNGKRFDAESKTLIAATLNSGGNNGGFRTEPGEHLVAYRTSGNCGVTEQGDRTAALNCGTDPTQNIVSGVGVRRLTPLECERLQGFPDEWTHYGENGEEISDSARYRMIGNAVAVPVAEWIGRRIMEAEKD